MKPRRNHPLQDPKTLPPLTLEEYEDFRSRLRHVRIAAALAFLFSLAVAVLHDMLKLNIPPGLLMGLGFGIVIYLLFRLLSLKCPRCGAVPMASRMSLTGTQVESASFVALNPKSCRKCEAQLSTKPTT